MTIVAPAPTSVAPTSRIRTQADLARVVATGLDALDARLAALLAGVPAGRWGVRRADGGWSLGEVLEHMCLSNEAYLARMRPMVAAGSAPGGSDTPWRPTLLGGLLARSLESPRKLPAPRSIRPGPSPRPDVVAVLRATHEEVRALMTRAAALDWRRLRMSSPFAWFVRPNFGDACLIILRHGERHAGQIERLAATIRA